MSASPLWWLGLRVSDRHGDSGHGAVQPTTRGRSHTGAAGRSHPQLQHLQYEQDPVSGEFRRKQKPPLEPQEVSNSSCSSVALSWSEICSTCLGGEMPFADTDSNYKSGNWNTGISIGLASANLMWLDIFIYFQLWVLFQKSQDGYFFFYKCATILAS